MKNRTFTKSLGVALVMILATSAVARGAYLTYYDEALFKAAAGPLIMESFETIKIDNWIYHTRLPSPIVALDLDDDVGDPNDGPDYDLDGHFTITGHNIAYAPADELFKIFDDGSTTDTVDGINFLSFSPWYNTLWPKTFDPENQHPLITFDNFNNNTTWVSAFGFYLYNYTPSENKWIVMEYGPYDIQLGLPAGAPTGNYFFGVVSTPTYVGEIQLHTNQNGGSIKIDEIYYSGVPEPNSLVLVAFGLVTLGFYRGWAKR